MHKTGQETGATDTTTNKGWRDDANCVLPQTTPHQLSSHHLTITMSAALLTSTLHRPSAYTAHLLLIHPPSPCIEFLATHLVSVCGLCPERSLPS